MPLNQKSKRKLQKKFFLMQKAKRFCRVRTTRGGSGMHISEWFYGIFFVYSIATTLLLPESHIRNQVP